LRGFAFNVTHDFQEKHRKGFITIRLCSFWHNGGMTGMKIGKAACPRRGALVF
jgi:hypothetical protein